MRALDDLRNELGSPDVGPLGLDEYQRCAVRLFRAHAPDVDKLNFLLLGLFGEVGSLLSELKKKQRDRNSYYAYGASTLEETGDALWYLANIVDHCGLRLSNLAARQAASLLEGSPHRLFLELQPQPALFHEPASPAPVQASLLALAETVGELIAHAKANAGGEEFKADLARIVEQLVSASTDAQVNLADAAQANLDKLLARWPIHPAWGTLLDAKYEPWEQFPRTMRILFDERRVGSRLYVFQSMNGVHVGDRLTDNSAVEDDYRFHDVFHLAFAAILGWSPVLRSLLKLKRKSRPEIDEQEDGARAALTEEGISNWIFAHGLRHDAFENVATLDFALLKTIAQMVKGYEVEIQPPWMWEHAILEGFRVFRDLRRHRGGLVVADLHSRTLTFEPPAQ
ncbi:MULTISPECIES: pyrophosphatase [unclassified Sphingomonas]|uniref:pyrophosphatase n=1 Tax=unclassified Sphingomonas TaxID=196159 RepID=UPI0028666C0D|nr:MULTISPECIES: pyrophosphatase [unclassified Sphingomonas]MDR6116016.1 NTP pyrophosphatase (non-canonical NTP hydrolase) [Sphingomonas sp. SORGH_AS_0789]MDR6150311.1 NTP pyrophosphatase (non-canonical NTP hydrolase) [Sphingomonas sp. SORGH_AS_0742]